MITLKRTLPALAVLAALVFLGIAMKPSQSASLASCSSQMEADFNRVATNARLLKPSVAVLNSQLDLVQKLTSRTYVRKTTKQILSTAAQIEKRASNTKALAQQFQTKYKDLTCKTTGIEESQLDPVSQTFSANEKSQAIIELMNNFLKIVASDSIAKIRKLVD